MSSVDSKIAQLEKVAWFSKAGAFQEDSAAGSIATWEQASQENVEWENARIFFRNLQTQHLHDHHKEVYRTWNSVVRDLKLRLGTNVFASVREAQEARGLPARVLHTVQWDILAALMDIAFADYIQPGIYTTKLELYERGFFPVGW